MSEVHSSTKWIMSVAASILILLVAGLLNEFRNKLNEHSSVLAAWGERIAHLESQSDGVERRQNELKESLEKIDLKLDTLIERIGRK
jgi:uncharacterized protein YoxC